MSNHISDEQWKQYREQGYLKLGRVLNENELTELRDRIDGIMLGSADVPYDRLLMQLDSDTGSYEGAGVQSLGSKGSTLNYRKIQELEHDPVFHAYVERPIFREISRRVSGSVPVSCFRAMFMNKPAHRGTLLPWHQDAWTDLDKQPEITLWTALDPATVANGCVQVIPGSHRLGRINAGHHSGFLSEEQVAEHCDPARIVYLEMEPGEAVLLHNWLLHRSDTNSTPQSRRAFSVCYMDGDTVASSGSHFTPLWNGEAA
ncbi:MAG: phytanoyl-CoA dioxygenase family protein [Capsulimonas sp.]|uniref:phytanoyl-CoA dioxygenase family protein n=1 Tax=Capsulimonas sp. TaxID=2494211 RepID=UPI0032655237